MLFHTFRTCLVLLTSVPLPTLFSCWELESHLDVKVQLRYALRQPFSNPLYPNAAVMNYHKLSGLKQLRFSFVIILKVRSLKQRLNV